MNTLKFKRVGKASLALPERVHETDAGVDLQSTKQVIIHGGETEIVPTGWAVHLVPGTVGFINPRSGLSAKTKLRIANAPGTIDAGYRGEIKVIIENTGIETIIIYPGDRIAQLVVVPVMTPKSEEVFENEETKRGAKGFGSSGT